MNEERIKERCKREDIALKIVKGFLKKDCYTDTELEYSLNTLLDLYNKQKEEKEDYISKAEIRDKILELTEIKGELEEKDFGIGFTLEDCYKEITIKIKAYKELLEEK